MGFLRRLLGRGDEGPEEPDEPHRDAPEDEEGAGIFAGLFVASPEELESWDLGGLTPADWPAVEFKRLHTVKLGTLEAILTRTQYDDLDQDELHDMLRDGGDEGPWISKVRHELVDALADLTPDRAATAAAAWADTDEFKARPSDKPSKDDIAELTVLLREMSDLARNSRTELKRMYLLMGL